jgi:hypothetical protein
VDGLYEDVIMADSPSRRACVVSDPCGQSMFFSTYQSDEKLLCFVMRLQR